MDDVITLSSDSENDSDLEIVGSYSNAMTAAAPLPLTAVRIDVDAVNVNIPMHYIDLTDPKWTLPVLKNRKRLYSTTVAVANVTDGYVANMKDLETLPPDNCQIKKESTDKSQTSSKQNVRLQENSSETPLVSALQLDCDGQKSEQSCLDSQTQHQKQPSEERHCIPTVKLRRLPFLETNVTELKRSSCSIYLTKDCMQMSLQQRHPDRIRETSECISNGPHTEPSLDESPPKMIDAVVRQKQEGNSNEFTSSLSDAKISQHPQSSAECSVLTSEGHITHEDKNDGFCSSLFIPSQTSPSSSQDKAQTSLQRELHCLNLEQLELVQVDSRQNSDRSSPHSPTTHLNISEPFKLNPLSHTNSISHNVMRQFNLTLTSKDATTENISELQSVEVRSDGASHSPDLVHGSSPCESPLSEFKTDMNMDDGSGTEINRWDLEIESPVSFLWQEGSDGEQADKESRFDMDFRAASREDMHFVCPVTLGKIMPGPVQAPIDVEDDDFATAEVLCHPSLSLVYTTMSENYPEGTLQLLSDLLQPGYYPPRDITVHLLHGILLDLHCPYHLCVQAFNLLIRTQRHHMADKTTVPWDWELLTSVMANQDSTKRHRSEVVRMFLEYIVQTLEDDFQAKRSMSTRHHSIAMATLSCDKHFSHVRDVIKWLFSAIMKSTDDRENREKSRERDEQIRIVCIFQRMLSLALEVDHSPAINSAKLSQELFLMLIGDTPLRAHRMMLLESLQSKLLRCKLLEHLLDYACPLKVPLPMSLSLLLHFMKNCILAPDPTDGTERWQRWEELVHLLWMLLLSYNKAMKGYLCSAGTEQRSMAGSLVYKQDDMLSKPAVREAVETFLSRSQADLGQALPRHVEESLTYLQDYLLDVCQC